VLVPATGARRGEAPANSGTTAGLSTNTPENAMSADKDRAIRRQKQKRAKHVKKETRQLREAAAGSATKQAAKAA
jgi:hypothetical protein